MSAIQIIRVDDAKAVVRVGVPDPERANPQEVRISVALSLGTAAPFASEGGDRIGSTIDYDRIIHFIRNDLGPPAHLIETLADRVAMHCLSLSPRVEWVEVLVKKPSVLSGDGMVSVTIRRERS